MERELGFSVMFADQADLPPHLRVTLDLANMATGDIGTHVSEMARTIPINTLAPAFEWFQAMAGQTGFRQPIVDGRDILIALPSSVTQAWQIAIILNLIDFSVAEEEPELRLVRRITVSMAGVANWSVPGVFASLRRHLDHARLTMTRRLPIDFWLDEHNENQWPDDAWNYTFDIRLGLHHPLPEPARAQLLEKLEVLELAMAWMAFATGASWKYGLSLSANEEIKCLDLFGPSLEPEASGFFAFIEQQITE